jgi:hypothetical protein
MQRELSQGRHLQVVYPLFLLAGHGGEGEEEKSAGDAVVMLLSNGGRRISPLTVKVEQVLVCMLQKLQHVEIPSKGLSTDAIPGQRGHFKLGFV